MNGRVHIARVYFRRSFVAPYPAWGMEPGGTIFIRCAGCHKCMDLDAPTTHQINEAGEVTPSVLCGDCGWHVFATLEGWGK